MRTQSYSLSFDFSAVRADTCKLITNFGNSFLNFLSRRVNFIKLEITAVTAQVTIADSCFHLILSTQWTVMTLFVVFFIKVVTVVI